MRVKPHRTDELIDALKQLKITDRRSRLSLRGRTGNSSGLLGGSNVEICLLNRLTRSVSSTNSCSHYNRNALCTSNTCECCAVTCHARARTAVTGFSPYHQSFDSSLHFCGDGSTCAEVRSCLPGSVSGFSPFTTSAGLLYSTLPTNPAFSGTGVLNETNNQDVLFRSSNFRRSYGANLNQLNAEPTSASRGSLGSSLTTSSDRHHCCIHHGPQTSNQLRLYRRLYSLIDHPSVNLYHSCRSPTCPHSVQACSHFYASYRHSLSLRTRHTVTAASPFSNKQIPVRLSIHEDLPDVTRQFKCTPMNDTLPTTSHLGGRDRLSEFSEGNSKRPENGTEPFFNVNEDHARKSHSVIRCRRNSDPERWQQFRIENVPEFPEEPSFSEALTVANAQCAQPRSVWCDKSVYRPTSAILPNVSPGTILPESVVRQSSFNSQLYAQLTGSTVLNIHSKPTIPCTDQTRQSTAFNSRFLKKQMDPESLHHEPSQQTSSVHFRPSFLPQTPMISPFSSTDINMNHEKRRPCVSDSQPTSWSGDGETPTASGPRPIFSSAGTVCDTPGAHSSFLDNNDMVRSLQEELSVLEQEHQLEDNIETDLSGAANRQALSDVSVNELASYMEHMVHIPGRMSEMAQRMYL